MLAGLCFFDEAEPDQMIGRIIDAVATPVVVCGRLVIRTMAELVAFDVAATRRVSRQVTWAGGPSPIICPHEDPDRE